MFQKAKRIIWQQLQRFAERKQWREVLQESRSEERLILRSVDTSCMDSLTQAEKEAYDRQWGWLGLPPSYREVEVFKHFNGFDPRYLSHYHYLPLIAIRRAAGPGWGAPPTGNLFLVLIGCWLVAVVFALIATEGLRRLFPRVADFVFGGR